MVAICVAPVIEVAIARVSLEYRSVMTSTSWLPFFVFNNGPRVSVAIKWSGLLARKRLRCRICVLFARVRAHSQQSFTVVYTSLATCSQYTLCCMVSYMICSAGVQLVVGSDKRGEMALVKTVERVSQSLRR